MKKLMLLAALLAMLAVAAIPAIAQVTQEQEQEGESGELDQAAEQTQSGDNSISCVNDQLTGNTQNVIDIIQYDSVADDFEFEEVGSDIDVSPTNTTDCTSEVNQAASAAA